MSVNDSKEDYIDLGQIVATVWRQKLAVSMVACVFTALALIYAITRPDIYTASVTLTPSPNAMGGSSLPMNSSLSSLANFAGLNLRNSSQQTTDVALTVLQSRKFLSAYIKKNELEPILLGTKEWDKKESKWIFNEKVYNPDGKRWISPFSTPRKRLDVAVMSLLSNTSVNYDKVTNIIKISYKSKSPVEAKKTLLGLITEVNRSLKDEAVTEAKKSIEFLDMQIGNTSKIEMQQALYSLVKQQVQTAMLAEITQEYAFKIIDPPTIPNEKSEPKRMLIVAAGLFIGILIGFAVAIVRGNSPQKGTASQ